MSASDRLSASLRLKRMDPHKLTRGKLLDAWITASGKGVRELLLADGIDDSAQVKRRESHYSQIRRTGMGHAAAVKVEQELEASGMRPGTLTSGLDLVELSDRGLRHAIEQRNRGVIQDEPAYFGKGIPQVKGGHGSSNDPAPSVKYLPVVPSADWGEKGVVVQSNDLGFELLALPAMVGATARRLAFPDDSFSPEIRKGDVVVVEYGAAPLPNDIVLCRSSHLDINFPGRYIQGMDGRASIELNQPGFEPRVSADDVVILAVVVYFLVGRKGRMPA